MPTGDAVPVDEATAAATAATTEALHTGNRRMARCVATTAAHTASGGGPAILIFAAAQGTGEHRVKHRRPWGIPG